jgi:hypothetical protein
MQSSAFMKKLLSKLTNKQIQFFRADAVNDDYKQEHGRMWTDHKSICHVLFSCGEAKLTVHNVSD